MTKISNYAPPGSQGVILPGTPGSTAPVRASSVTYDNGTSGLVSTDVQDAIDELAAGGMGPGSGDIDVEVLDDLADVTIAAPSDGDVLTYDSGTSAWVNLPPTGGPGSGDVDITTLAGLDDVDVSGVADTDLLQYDSGSGLWIPGSASGVADITDLPTAETDTAKRLAPDGAGGVEWVTGGGGSSDAWLGPSGSGGGTIPGLAVHERQPASPNAKDQEFDSAHGGTTLGTLDVNNITDYPSHLHIERACSAEIDGVYWAVPASTPYTITAHFRVADLTANLTGGVHPAVGIMLLDGTPTAIRSFDLGTASAAFYISMRRYTNRTAFSSSVDNAVTVALRVYDLTPRDFYLRLLVSSSSSVTFSYSWEGFLWLTPANLTAIDPTITPAYFGISVSDPVTGTPVVRAVVDSIRIT